MPNVSLQHRTELLFYMSRRGRARGGSAQPQDKQHLSWFQFHWQSLSRGPEGSVKQASTCKRVKGHLGKAPSKVERVCQAGAKYNTWIGKMGCWVPTLQPAATVHTGIRAKICKQYQRTFFFSPKSVYLRLFRVHAGPHAKGWNI